MNQTKFLILVMIISVIVGSASSLIVFNIQYKSNLINEFYDIENEVYVSPHGLRKHMDQGGTDFILVDLRSQEEYEKEHIIGAINIPAYRNPDTSAYEDVDRIVAMFRSLQDGNPGKNIVVYCYSIPCMTGRKVGKMLIEHGIYVKQLGIGWNEWRYYWNLWNHEHEWNQTKAEDYTYSGTEPGVPKLKLNSTVCDISGELGC